MGGTTTKYLLLAGMLPALAFFAALALADDQGSMMGSRGMMSDSYGTMMGRGMQSCMQMMQGMHSENRRPNEQWRHR